MIKKKKKKSSKAVRGIRGSPGSYRPTFTPHLLILPHTLFITAVVLGSGEEGRLRSQSDLCGCVLGIPTAGPLYTAPLP